MSSKQNNLSNWTKPKIWYLVPDICIFSCQPCLRALVQVTSSAFFFFDNPFNLSFLLVFLFLDYLSNYNTTYIVTWQVHLLYPQVPRNFETLLETFLETLIFTYTEFICIVVTSILLVYILLRFLFMLLRITSKLILDILLMFST